MTRSSTGRCLVALSLLPTISFSHIIRTVDPVPVDIGCFSSVQPLVSQGYHKYQSSGWCSNEVCAPAGFSVIGLSNGTLCFCGDELPPKDTEVVPSKCDTPCQGYNLEDCGGGTQYFTVWLTGLRSNVQHYNPDSSSSTSSASATHGAAATHTRTHLTSKTTPATAATAPPGIAGTSLGSKTNSGHDRKLAIGLGVGLGVLAIAILAGIFMFLSRRRKRTGKHVRELSPNSEVGKAEAKPAYDEKAYQSTNGVVRNQGPATNQMTTTTTVTTTPTIVTTTHLDPPRPTYLSPNVQQSSQATSMYDQPFYTPAEQRSFYFAGSEDGHSAREADLPPQVPPIPVQRENFDFNFHPRDDGDPRPESGLAFGPMNDIGESDSVDIVYSSGSGLDGVDPSGIGTQHFGEGNQAQPNIHNDGRRYELP